MHLPKQTPEIPEPTASEAEYIQNAVLHSVVSLLQKALDENITVKSYTGGTVKIESVKQVSDKYGNRSHMLQVKLEHSKKNNILSVTAEIKPNGWEWRQWKC